jgi:hypothetical protein
MDTIFAGKGRIPAPRYCPRDYCAEPESFGYAATVRWIQPKDERSAALTTAAHLQHRYAVRIRQRAKFLDKQAKGSSLAAVHSAAAEDTHHSASTEAPRDKKGAGVGPTALRRLAAKTGSSYPRLLRALRGEVVLRLDDIAWADLILGEISEFAQPKPAVGTPFGHPARG